MIKIRSRYDGDVAETKTEIISGIYLEHGKATLFLVVYHFNMNASHNSTSINRKK